MRQKKMKKIIKNGIFGKNGSNQMAVTRLAVPNRLAGVSKALHSQNQLPTADCGLPT